MDDPVPRVDALEPSFTVVSPPGSARRRLRLLAPALAMVLLATGTTGLAATGHLGLPFQRITTLNGRLASTGDLFEDPQVIRILLKHGLRVHTISAGSREVATGSLKGLDFVFPSGQPAADQIHETRQTGGYSNDVQPFDSFLVLATYREYAETLVDHGEASAVTEGSGDGKPLYYRLDMHKFLDLTERGLSWNDIGISEQHDISQDNLVLARTSNICQSNSADSYLGLIASTLGPHNEPPQTAQEARELTPDIARLLHGQGSSGADLSEKYESEGPGDFPIVVMYEHQYLAYQAAYKAEHGTADSERVLLYPSAKVLSEPHFIALDKKADRLGSLLRHDPELRQRETQLGYRITGRGSTAALPSYLRGLGIPAPPGAGGNLTNATMPDYKILDQMVTGIGDCPPPVKN